MSTKAQHPGANLLECFLKPLGISPSALAESIRVPVSRVSELISGSRSIDPDMAARLALFFDVPAEWWLRQQAHYDAEHLAPVEELRGVVAPYLGLSDVLVTPHGVKRLTPARSAPAQVVKATFSDDFVARLRAQTEGMASAPRVVTQRTLPDGTVALVGECGDLREAYSGRETAANKRSLHDPSIPERATKYLMRSNKNP